MLNDNYIKGDISDPAILKQLQSLKRLEILELGNLPGARCPAGPLQWVTCCERLTVPVCALRAWLHAARPCDVLLLCD